MQKIIVKAEEEMLKAIEKALKCLGVEYVYKDSMIDFAVPEKIIECSDCEDGIELLKNIVNQYKREYC